MAIAAFVLAYVGLCFITGYFGRDRRVGYAGTVVLSFFITPVLMVLILVFFGPSSAVEWRSRRKASRIERRIERRAERRALRGRNPGSLAG
jgi:uncharacterized membrane protein